MGLKIEDEVLDGTSFVIFRRRLGEDRFESIFNRSVESAKQKGLLKERYQIVDATSYSGRCGGFTKGKRKEKVKPRKTRLLLSVAGVLL